MAPKAAAKAALQNTLAAYGPDMGNDNIKCLVCGEGSKTFMSWTSLKKHLLRSHPISAKDLKGTYVAQMTRKVPTMTRAEHLVCEPVAGNESVFWCNLCSRQLGKANAYRHFTKTHRKDKDDVKPWAIVKDNWKAEGTGPSIFTISYNNFNPDLGDDASEAEAAGMGPDDMEPGERAAGMELGEGQADMDIEDDLGDQVAADMEADEDPDADTIPGTPSVLEAMDGDPHPQESQGAGTGGNILPSPESQPSNPAPANIIAGIVKEVQTTLVREVQSIRGEVKAALATKATEIPVPAISIFKEAQQWQPDYEEGTKRYTCPLKEQDLRCSFDLTAFESWLKTNGAQKKSTIKGNLQSVKRLTTILEIHKDTYGEWHDIAGFLVGLYEQNIIPELMKVPFMDLKFTWARNMLQGLDHLATFAGQQCNRKHATITKNLVQALKDEAITPFKNQACEQRKLQMAIKKQVDSKRLDSFPPTAITKAAVLQAMMDLAVLAKCCHLGDPAKVMAAATTIMVGILWFNGYGGRSGEWQILEKAHVFEAMHKNLDYLEFHWHKTSYVYGDLAKWVAPGTWKAIAVYLGLACHSSKFFLCPANEKTWTASVAYYLKRFCCKYLKDFGAVNVNLIRKLFHTALKRMERQGVHMNVACTVDPHSRPVAEQVYCCLNKEDDWKLGKQLFEQVMGTPVEWPATKPKPGQATLQSVLTLPRGIEEPSLISIDDWAAQDEQGNLLIPEGLEMRDTMLAITMDGGWHEEAEEEEEELEDMFLAIEDMEEEDNSGNARRKKKAGEKECKKAELHGNWVTLRRFMKKGLHPQLKGHSSKPCPSSAASSSMSVPMAGQGAGGNTLPQTVPLAGQGAGGDTQPQKQDGGEAEPAQEQPTKKRKGPQPKCSEAEFAWVLQQAEQIAKDRVPTESELGPILAHGRATGVFTSTISLGGIRTFLRRTMSVGSFYQYRPHAEEDAEDNAEDLGAEAMQPNLEGAPHS